VPTLNEGKKVIARMHTHRGTQTDRHIDADNMQ